MKTFDTTKKGNGEPNFFYKTLYHLTWFVKKVE